jgi:hypothetical protein
LQGHVVDELEPGGEGAAPDVVAAVEPETVDENAHTAVQGEPTEVTSAEAAANPDGGDDLTLDDEPAVSRAAPAKPESIDLDDDDAKPDEPKSPEAAETESSGRKTEAATPQVDDAEVVDDDKRSKSSAKGDPVPCQACDTTGQCSHCNGKGRRARFFRCSECGGSGRCSVCGGPGYVWADS